MAQSDLMPTSISLGSTSVAAGGSLPAAPTPTEYFDASYAAYAQNTSSAPSGMTLLFSSDSSELSDGFFAQAFEDSNGNVIIAFEGTVQDNTAYGKATQAADAGILGGNLLLQPTAPTQILQDAYAFAFSVVATDALTGISGATYVTGHSLGGYEAEYVAQQLPSSISLPIRLKQVAPR